MRQKVEILGIKVDSLTAEELQQDILSCAASAETKTIMYVNAHSINLTRKEKQYRDLFNSADILHPDGWGIFWASCVLKTPLKEGIVVTNFFIDCCKELAKRKISIYLLGGAPGVAEKAKEELRGKIPELNVVGAACGYFKKEEESGLVAAINRSRPDILIMGMGTPLQEEWICRNKHRLDVSLCWAVGGLFDFISGRIKRAPRWLREIHLEWLYRLNQEPARLWKRYILGNPLFVLRVIKSRLFPEFTSPGRK
jgi:N-acetylglucosaminyldiphosphoundecaprenol N-acetyl-beta-D-mannosaminyltransferase